MTNLAGRLALEIYERGGSTAITAIGTVLSAQVTEPISALGSWSVDVPTSVLVDTGLSLVEGREVLILREGEGQVYRGICTRETTAIGDAEVTTLSGASLAVELVWDNTYMGLMVDDLTMQQALDLVLPAGWTGTATGSYNNVTKRFDNMTLLEAIGELATIGNAYWRETGTARHIEIKDTSGVSGLLVTNVEQGGPALTQNPDIGPIVSIGARVEDATELYNRIVAVGTRDNNVILDLGRSDRSSPYTIQNIVLHVPSVIETKYLNNVDQANGNAPVQTELRGFIRGFGVNRAVLIFAAVFTDNAAADFSQVNVGGIVAQTIFQTQGSFTDYLFGGFIATGVQEGELAISVVTSDPTPGRIDAVAISLQNVDQFSPIRDFTVDLEYNNNFSPLLTPTISVANIASDANDLLLDGLMVQRSTGDPDATPAGGQTSLGAELEWGATAGQVFGLTIGSSKPGASGDQTMSWTLSPGDNILWAAHAGVSVKSQPVYYIEDATSVTAHGRRVQILPLLSFKSLLSSTPLDEANTMYDAAVDFLLDHKDPQHELDGLVPAFLRRSGWFPGDSLKVEYRGAADITADMVAVQRQATYDGDGARSWSLTLSSTKRFIRGLGQLLGDMQSQLEAVTQNQV